MTNHSNDLFLFKFLSYRERRKRIILRALIDTDITTLSLYYTSKRKDYRFIPKVKISRAREKGKAKAGGAGGEIKNKEATCGVRKSTVHAPILM